MTLDSPKWIDSEYLIIDEQGWRLKEDAPLWLVKEFNKFMKLVNSDKSIEKDQFVSVKQKKEERKIFFKDVSSKSIVLVKWNNEKTQLERLHESSPEWRYVGSNSSYEREFYLGQGNNCLDEISEDEFISILREWNKEHLL